MSTTPRIILIAGASGSGKSRLALAAGCPTLRLDDYYFDADHPDMPSTNLGIPDWDDPASWDAAGALAGLQELLTTGELVAPDYSITESRRVGSHRVHLDGCHCLTVEGIFAIEFLGPLSGRRAGRGADLPGSSRPVWSTCCGCAATSPRSASRR